MTISIASRKAKGRKLQQEVVKQILNRFYPGLTEDDVRSASMGANGEDVVLSAKARRLLHCSFECKAQELFSALSTAMDQARANAKGASHVPVVVVKTKRSKPYAVLDLNVFLDMIHMLHYYQKDWHDLLG